MHALQITPLTQTTPAQRACITFHTGRYGMRTLAQPSSTAHTPSPSETPATQADIAKALESALGDQPAAKSNARFSSVSITLMQ